MALDNDRSMIAHLLRRAAFGYTAAELDQYTALGFQGALDRLLNPEQVDDSATDQLVAPLAVDPADPDARKHIEAAKVWWFNRMLYTQRPLQEKMALFWHNHFATANSKVGNALLMVGQVGLFRDNGLGSFETLLQRVTRDPAMLVWLDNRENRKNAPNENYAREVMELFTLGIGNYTEEDVKEGARAFTGYTLTKSYESIFNARVHDDGVKTFLGQTGTFDADDAVGILVRHPATARFLATRLFTYFVDTDPAPATIDRLAATFVSTSFDIRSVLRDLFTGPEFSSPTAFHGLIKQPVDFVAGAIKALEVQNVGPDVVQTLRRMGQDLLNPPDVSGWRGGDAWINGTTLFERYNFANKLASSRDAAKPYFADVAGTVTRLGLRSDSDLVDYYLKLLVDGDTTAEARQSLLDYVNSSGPMTFDDPGLDTKARGLVHLAMAVPTYQLA